MINKAFNGYGLGLSDSLVEASKKVVESSAAYKKFFAGALKKFGVTSPAELDGAKKKEFFAYVEDNWNSEDEEGKDGKKEEVEEAFSKKPKSGEEISKLMMKNKSMKGFASKVKKMKTVTASQLDKMLPDYVSGGDISKMFEELEERFNQSVQED